MQHPACELTSAASPVSTTTVNLISQYIRTTAFIFLKIEMQFERAKTDMEIDGFRRPHVYMDIVGRLRH